MAKPNPNTKPSKAKANGPTVVDQVKSKKLDLADETLLAYALELGSRVALIQCLRGSNETDELQLFKTEHIEEIAHFVFRQWPDRVVEAKSQSARDPKSEWTWTVSKSLGGDSVVFESLAPEQVSKRMMLALAGPEVKGQSPVIEARHKLRWVHANRANEIVAKRRDEAVWPPVQGTVRARALELTLASKWLLMSKGSENSMSYPVEVTSRPVLAKLKDPDFHLVDVKEDHHDKNSKNNDMAENRVKFELLFGPITDANNRTGLFSYEGLAIFEVPESRPFPASKSSRKKKA